MAKPQDIIGRVGFKRVQLLKKNTLGIGSYGKVCLAKCDDLLCAAKVMHETLFDPTSLHLIVPEREHRLPIRRFEKECGYLNSIRHPNIVQCLCIFEDPDTSLPVLMMELMDSNLTHFLEKASKQVSYHIQVNVCHDITFALSYLHSNGITHRDLSSNNVLLIGNVRAKLSDFGMAKLGDTSHTFTVCPGTDVYMPPESVEDKPLYTETMDCFSFGVIIVQILTQEFPEPSDRYKIIEICHPQVSGRKVKVSISEVERRQNHISLVDPSNPLLQIAFDCLKDQFDERPSAQQLCEHLMVLKKSSEYHKSERAAEVFVQITEKELKVLKMQHALEVKSLQEIIKIQQNHLDEKDRIIANIIADKSESTTAGEEIIQLRKELTEAKELVREKDLILEEKEKLLEHVSQQLKISERTRVDFGRQVNELERQLSQEKPTLTKHSEISSDTPVEHKTASTIKIRWTKGKRAPCKVSAPMNAALHANAVYIRPPGKIVYVYSLNMRTWLQLPCCPTTNCPLVIVNDFLTLVGGCDKDRCTNRLFSLTGEGSGNWSQEFPSMPTKRYGVAALFAGIALIVAGGVGESESVLTVVEVLNTESSQWSTAASLLDPLVNSLVAVCDGLIYVVGGDDGGFEPTSRVYTCELTALLESVNPKSKAGRFKGTLRRSSKAKVWSGVADLPLIQPSCVFLHGCLLAIGGRDLEHRPSSAVHAYVPTNNSWEVISHMETPRYSCFAAILPDNQVMVIGGITDKSRTKTDTVEMGSLLKLIIT